MRIVRPNATPANAGGGRSGESGIPSWRRKWIESKVVNVVLECGHIECILDRALLFINTFDGCQVDCVKCGKFVTVIGPVKKPRVKYPQQPLF